MKIHNVAQGTPEWHALRSRMVTASMISQSPWMIWAIMTGKVEQPDLSRVPPVLRGRKSERLARDRFEERHDMIGYPVVAESSTEPGIGCSFDFLGPNRFIAEFKGVGKTSFEEVKSALEAGCVEDSDLVKQYNDQVQLQMFVAERGEAILVFSLVESIRGTREDDGWPEVQIVDTIEVKILRDEARIGELVTKAKAVFSALKTGKEPKKDPATDIYIPKKGSPEEQRAQTLVSRKREIKAARAKLEEEMNNLDLEDAQIDGQLTEMMGSFSSAEFCHDEKGKASLTITRFLEQGRVSWQKAFEALAPSVSEEALEPYRGKPVEKTKVSLRKMKVAAAADATSEAA